MLGGVILYLVLGLIATTSMVYKIVIYDARKAIGDWDLWKAWFEDYHARGEMTLCGLNKNYMIIPNHKWLSAIIGWLSIFIWPILIVVSYLKLRKNILDSTYGYIK